MAIGPVEGIGAANHREAIAIFKRQSATIDCVILDLTMPEMDGVAVIVMSGYDEQAMVRRVAEDRPAGFVQKPFQLFELKAKLEEAFRRST